MSGSPVQTPITLLNPPAAAPAWAPGAHDYCSGLGIRVPVRLRRACLGTGCASCSLPWCEHARKRCAAWVHASRITAHEVDHALPGHIKDAISSTLHATSQGLLRPRRSVACARKWKLPIRCKPHAMACPSINDINAKGRKRRAKSIACATCGRAGIPPSRLPSWHAALVGRRRAAGVGSPGYLPGAEPAAGDAADTVAVQPGGPYHNPKIPGALRAGPLRARLPHPGGRARHHRAGLLGGRRHRRHLHLHAACVRLPKP